MEHKEEIAEYLEVDYDGFYNSYKQNTELLDTPIISNTFWVAPRRPAFLLDVSSRTLGRVVCDPELKVSRGGGPYGQKNICNLRALVPAWVCHA